MANQRDGDRPNANEKEAERVITQPLGLKRDSVQPSASKPEAKAEKTFDPLKSGLNEYSTDLFTQLVTADVPMVPKDQLFETRPPATRDLRQVADPLPAVESPPPSSSAIPVHSKKHLVIGVLAVLVLALVLFFTTRDSEPGAKTRDEPTPASESTLPPPASVAAPPLVPSPPAALTPRPAEPPKRDRPSPESTATRAIATPRPQNPAPNSPTPSNSVPQVRAAAHPAIGPRPE